MLRDILRGDSPDIADALDRVAAANADILLLTDFDYDAGLAALSAFSGALPVPYPHLFALRPNTGWPTGLDLDGNGWLGDARDAQGYGDYAGQGGMALLSRFPIEHAEAVDFSSFLWRELPGALLSSDDAGHDVQRLSSAGHWVVPLHLPDGRSVTVLAFHATPPVFDGPEDRNGRRNHDEAAFWLRYLDGRLAEPAPSGPVILFGDANMDPYDSEGRAEALRALLSHARLQDPEPASSTGARLAAEDGGANMRHQSDPTRDTANWSDGPGRPGNLRVDYVLPSRDWQVLGAGIIWPVPPPDPDALLSRHGLVWVDLVLDRLP